MVTRAGEQVQELVMARLKLVPFSRSQRIAGKFSSSQRSGQYGLPLCWSVMTIMKFGLRGIDFLLSLDELIG
jgi:hypothetical protein